MASFDIANNTLTTIGLDCLIWLIGIGIPESVPSFDLEPLLKVIGSISGNIQVAMNEIVNSSGSVIKELNTLSGFDKSHAILLKEISQILDDIASMIMSPYS